MARVRTLFFCRECGNETARWEGQCPACGAWNTLVDAPAPAVRSSGARPIPSQTPTVVRLADIEHSRVNRRRTGLSEFDFVLGGGIVPGSLLLVGGEPGIGKSTLLLQVAARLEREGAGVLYVSGEESAGQVRLRAERLDPAALDVPFLAETSLDAILDEASKRKPGILFIDSVQTVTANDTDGAAGSIAQLRACAARVQRYAKIEDTAVVLVGHVTKDGSVAGPKALEHIVDTVLYFEDAPGADHRVLRATKNRFGSADEIGVFRMTGAGLEPVENPSALYLADRAENVAGSAVTPAIEGTRPLLVEVQALCSRASYGAPQRVATGFDRQRLALLLAVLEKRAGLAAGQFDVFLNVAGGARLIEPAADLAVAVAVASSAQDLPVPANAVFIGEVGLGGELRNVGQMERRLAEAVRLGFDTAFVPAAAASVARRGLRVRGMPDVPALLESVFT
ncbi:MAG: DNA repair protein RadA [Longimicrobiales bacterium]